MKDVIKFAVFLYKRIETDYPGSMGQIVAEKLSTLTTEYIGRENIDEFVQEMKQQKVKLWGA